MEKIIFNQDKNIKQYFIGGAFLLVGLFSLFSGEASIKGVLIFLVGLIFIGFHFKYEINKDFNNKKHVAIFGLKLFSFKLVFPFPDYISLFSLGLSTSNEYGALSAIGHDSKSRKFVIKFFNGNQHITLYKTNSHQEALDKSNSLKDLLDVELYNAVEEQSR